ncbi:hypothetical protein [Streptomyces cyaneofuscatus]|uniref:hypothetical protein n=1 Tax=Streptomyces cyaneofuscatus TaxID=66883 RepID=UPI0033B06891
MKTSTPAAPGPSAAPAPPAPAPAPKWAADPATTLAGWRATVRAPSPTPPALEPLTGAESGEVLSEEEELLRERHPRVRYHADLGLIRTSDIQDGERKARRLLHDYAGKPGPYIAIDSDYRGTGKRTLLHHIGIQHQQQREARHGIDDDRIPVVCINVPPLPDTPADWSAALASFLGWDLYRPDTDNRPVQRMKDFTGPAVHILRTRQAEVCLVDGIDRLRAEDVQPTFDFFDYLADELRMTILISGLGASDILREALTARAPALRRDSDRSPLRPRPVPTLWVNRLPAPSPEHPEEWARTLVSFDDKLRLCHHRPKSLLEIGETLYRITDGLMELLCPLLSMAAQAAIIDGTEAITEKGVRQAADYLDIVLPDDTAASGSALPEQ